jgi:histidinol-phosphate aminotransferase
VQARLLQALTGLGRDPDPQGLELRGAIAARHGFGPEQVILGPGCSDLVGLAARALLLDGGSGLAAQYSFARFGAAVQAAGGRFIESRGGLEEADPDSLLAAVRPDTRIVYVAQPNNPTGALLDRAALERLVRGLRPDILLVVDQALAEYVEPEAFPDAAALLPERANLLVLHSCSKLHGLAALPLGYGLGGADLPDLLARVQTASASPLARVAALAALQDEGWQALSRARNQEARTAFLARAGAHRCRVSGQAGNFLLLETQFPARELERDLRSRGVLVRPLCGYDLPYHVRVAMGRPQDMAAFWQAAAPQLDRAGCGCP